MTEVTKTYHNMQRKKQKLGIKRWNTSLNLRSSKLSNGKQNQIAIQSLNEDMQLLRKSS